MSEQSGFSQKAIEAAIIAMNEIPEQDIVIPQAFPTITEAQWEEIRQEFIDRNTAALTRSLERKLGEGYFSEAYYPIPETVSHDSWFLNSQIRDACERRAAVKISEFWNDLMEIVNVDRFSDAGKYLINTTLMTVNAERGKNCGGMSPETFMDIYANFKDIFARVTKTGKYDPEIEDDEEDDSW